MNQFDEIKILNNNFFNYITYEDNKIPFSFITDDFELNLRKKRLVDFKIAIDDGCTIQPVEVPSLKNIFNKFKVESILTIEELYTMQKYLESLQNMKDGLLGRTEYEVNELFLDLVSFPNILRRLSSSITPDMEISSDASSLLASLRRNIERLKASMDSVALNAQKKYSEFLSDTKIAFKNGYSTLAINSTNKNKIDGIVTATSNSGNTAYVIPNEVLALSSKIMEEEEKERAEVQRIIEELSELLFSVKGELIKVYNVALIIDRTYAAVLFGNTYHGSIAKFSKNIVLKDFGHPLISEDKLVVNDLSLDEKKILLISGPNAGGKTVFLKSLQIAAILNQAGLMVPSSYAELPIFDHIFFLAGDNQSVLDNLSTFSSHVRELEKIAVNMTNNSLVIIDEIGQGTSPLEGSALGVAFIKKAERTNSFLILTSHYEDLKDYCLNNDFVLSAKMVFDEENLIPTFKINYGVAGHSFGIAVAKKLGMPEDIITDALNFVEEKRSDPLKQNLDLLNKRLAEVEEEKANIILQKQELERLSAKRQRAIDSVQRQLSSLKEREEEIIEEHVEKRIEEIDKIWNKNGKLGNFAEVSKIKGELNKIIKPKEEEKPKKGKKTDYQISDNVRVLLTGQDGVITEKRGNKYKVNVGGLSLTVDADNLELLPNNAPIKKAKPTNPIDRVFMPRADIKMEVNVIGLRANEAEEKIKQYLDSCILMRYHRVRIIHGVGSGVLQKLTWKILSENKNVQSYSFGGEGEGGVGATVVYFK